MTFLMSCSLFTTYQITIPFVHIFSVTFSHTQSDSLMEMIWLVLAIVHVWSASPSRTTELLSSYHYESKLLFRFTSVHYRLIRHLVIEFSLNSRTESEESHQGVVVSGRKIIGVVASIWYSRRCAGSRQLRAIERVCICVCVWRTTERQ